MRVLVLEDNDDLRLALSFVVRSEGHEVFDFATAEDAERALDSLMPEVALLDVRLPGKSGDEFARELVRRHPGTRVIFTTAEADIDRLKAAVPGSMVMRKPVDLMLLRPLIACI